MPRNGFSLCRVELGLIKFQNWHKIYQNLVVESGFKLIYGVILISFIASGNVLRAEAVFFVMAVSNLLRVSMGSLFPTAVYSTTEFLISMRRFQVRHPFLHGIKTLHPLNV